VEGRQGVAPRLVIDVGEGRRAGIGQLRIAGQPCLDLGGARGAEQIGPADDGCGVGGGAKENQRSGAERSFGRRDVNGAVLNKNVTSVFTLHHSLIF
jgi:hypothetical protein